MNFDGIIIGISTFAIIGIFHPLVIKGEYYFGTRCWWVFLIMGLAGLIASPFISDTMVSTIGAVWGAWSLWGIGGLFEQKKKKEKGWFPKREKRPKDKA